MKNKIKFVLKYSTYIFLTWCVFVACKELHSPTYTDCGIVESKSSDEVYIKHGTKTELYLNITFKNTGFSSIKCSPTIYFQYHKGDYVCFNLENDLSKFERFSQIVGLLTLCLVFTICVMKFVIYITD